MTREFDVEKIGVPDVALKFETAIDRRTAREVAWNIVNAWPLLLAMFVWTACASALCAWLRDKVAPEFSINGASAAPLNSIARALYYNASMLTSVGATDIAPASTGARAISLIDSVLGVVLLGIIVGMACTAFEASKGDGVVKAFLKSTWAKLPKMSRHSSGNEIGDAHTGDGASTKGMIEQLAGEEAVHNQEGRVDHAEAGSVATNQTTDQELVGPRAPIYKAMLECLSRGRYVDAVKEDRQQGRDSKLQLTILEMLLQRALKAVLECRLNVIAIDQDTEKAEENIPRSYIGVPSSILIEISIALGETSTLIDGNAGDLLGSAIRRVWESSVVVGQSVLLPADVFETLIGGLRVAHSAAQKLVLAVEAAAGTLSRRQARL